MTNRTPSQGLKILEQLHKKHPHHQGIKNSLIDAYIKLGYHDVALEMIDKISNKKIDVVTLRFKMWQAHKTNHKVLEKEIWNKIHDRSYIPELDYKIKDLIKRSNHNTDIKKQDICLFCVERNEMIQLPYFLLYYRQLGITQFFFVDNNSDDGSLEFLLEQADCHVWWTSDSYTQMGVRYINYLIDNYILDNQWYIVADADEYLVYPNCEQQKLKQLTNYLDRGGFEAVSCYMLDFFPENYQKQIQIKSGDNLLQKAPYFYNNYYFYDHLISSYKAVYGGIFHYFFPYTSDWLYKVLLMKKGIKPTVSNHNSSPAIISPITSVALHFKLIGDVGLKSKIETGRKIHNGGGIRYQRYATLFENIIYNEFKFTDLPKTTKYENSHQLVDLKLINTSDDWEKEKTL